VAAVSSPPLARIVEMLLMASDNDAAEVLFRQVAIAGGRTGSTVEAGKAMRAELTRLGVWTDGTRIVDGSGLARQNRVPAATLARLLRLSAEDEGSRLRAVVTGLPVAGVEGTLRRRFGDDASLAGRGVVRGKTGTLRKVQSLAGMLRTRDGSVLVFAFLVNNPKNAYNARVWLDRVTAAISTCGCR
jgi:D-alanyl-D-alanine carboxypeptidase/D-alanyl-D-alanine-endopeptidase (penicillin-binding protein 4)